MQISLDEVIRSGPLTLEPPETFFNIAQFLPASARSAPQRTAVICEHRPDDLGRTTLTFRELNEDSDSLAWGLSRLGVAPGSRTLLMVKPGLEFISLTFALFKLGAIPVLIDPGMGRKNLLSCIAQVRPENLIAVPLAHALRTFSGGAFKSVGLSVTVGSRWFWGGPTLRHVRACASNKPFPLAKTTRTSPAAILFTSGGTGIPKGVLYEHGMFGAQVEAIRDEYQIEPGEVDLACFPLFALFDAAFGTTCVIPEMNPSRPAQCDPEKIVNAIKKHQVTYSFGSPAIWKRVGPWCLEKRVTLPNVKRILIAGAPVRGEVLEPFKTVLSNGNTFIPYGATEALPVATIRGSDVLEETWEQTRRGKGFCVGRPLPGVEVRITTGDLLSSSEEKGPRSEIGEIIVKGSVVTEEYFEMPEQTRSAKIQVSHESVWHRMGDMGYFDESGRLWFCGRKAHRVLMENTKVLYSICVEAEFETGFKTIFPKVSVRSALVGVGKPGHQEPILVIENNEDVYEHCANNYDTTTGILEDPSFVVWYKEHPLSKSILRVLHYPRDFPVDVRHNAKINREKLGEWAAAQIQRNPTTGIVANSPQSAPFGTAKRGNPQSP
jgi:acyl-CoA synthetase (AMP-forming)/AMP-acid ligase II